jgi:hypothetical protein
VRSNAIEQTDLAYDSSVPLLDYFEENFQIQYFMPKLGKIFNTNTVNLKRNSLSCVIKITSESETLMLEVLFIP